MTVKTKLIEYDLSKDASQVQNEMSKLHLVLELRMSGALWGNLIRSNDQVFFDNMTTVTSNTEVLKGNLGSLYGTRVSSEVVIERTTTMMVLPGNYYLIFYQDDPNKGNGLSAYSVVSDQSSGSDSGLDLIDLIKQVTI